MTSPTVTAVSDERLRELCIALDKHSHAEPVTRAVCAEAITALRELLRARSALADVGELLVRYGRHDDGCKVDERAGTCECGLRQAIHGKQPRPAAEWSDENASAPARCTHGYEYSDLVTEAVGCTPRCHAEAHQRSPAAHTAQVTAQLSSAPWRVVKGKENIGHGWPVAFMGCDHNGDNWYIETHGVHASEAVSEPENDAKAIVAWRNSLAEQGSAKP